MDKLKALIVDDDRDTANLFSTVLEIAGFECETVFSAKGAMISLSGNVPNLILLDLRLGLDVSGAHILFQLRANPRFDATRVIVITSYSSMAQPIANLADLVLLKPVDVDQLKTLAERLGTFETQPKSALLRDPITELYNREYFISRLELAFERAQRRSDFLFAVIVLQIELTGLGDSSPDPDETVLVLQTAAKQLSEALRTTDAVARFSAQRFAALHEELQDSRDIETIIRRLEGSLSTPIPLAAATCQLQACFGAAVYSAAEYSVEELLAQAEEALEAALEGGLLGAYFLEGEMQTLPYGAGRSPRRSGDTKEFG